MPAYVLTLQNVLWYLSMKRKENMTTLIKHFLVKFLYLSNQYLNQALLKKRKEKKRSEKELCFGTFQIRVCLDWYHLKSYYFVSKINKYVDTFGLLLNICNA